MVYRFLWLVLIPFITWPWRVKVLHRDRVPATGGVLLTPNHESYLDPVLVGMAIWRPLHAMARDNLWKNPALGWLFTHMLAFPVKRGSADRAAISRASELLESGEQVLIFPQGTRHHAPGLEGMAEGAGGAALIALRTGVPVVPVGINGTDRIKPKGARFLRFPALTVSFGEPIDPADVEGESRRERVDALMARIMEGMVEAYADAGRRDG
jgi:1-acyl-sn-glycerol-3-phosphate acyltransferase